MTLLVFVVHRLRLMQIQIGMLACTLPDNSMQAFGCYALHMPGSRRQQYAGVTQMTLLVLLSRTT